METLWRATDLRIAAAVSTGMILIHRAIASKDPRLSQLVMNLPVMHHRAILKNQGMTMITIRINSTLQNTSMSTPSLLSLLHSTGQSKGVMLSLTIKWGTLINIIRSKSTRRRSPCKCKI